ncbi:CoA-binding protein [Oxalobacter sp. OttesenSCG-928-P03]|nr:CoA-binding protein [Oxalobacter sp. OttesenSCG-928-P03]
MIVESDRGIRDILQNVRTIAAVGCTPHPGAGNMVPLFLMERGFNVIPVNPEHDEVFGLKCYSSLKDIPVKIDMVDCFIPSDAVFPVAEEAIAIGAGVLWMQLGVINEKAAGRASDAGLKVVMNRCPHIEIPRLFDRD